MPINTQAVRTTAERVAGSRPGTAGMTGTGRIVNTDRSDPAPRQPAPTAQQRERQRVRREERQSRAATVAIVACSLVAVLAMLVHTAVPHHHHTHFVALVCLHHHAGEAHLAAPVCPGSGEGCQAEDSADCHPCGQQGQAALRPAVRQWHGSMPACHRLVPPLDFLPALLCLCPGPLMAAGGRCKPGDVCPVPARGAFHGLCPGRRAPPCGC